MTDLNLLGLFAADPAFPVDVFRPGELRTRSHVDLMRRLRELEREGLCRVYCRRGDGLLVIVATDKRMKVHQERVDQQDREW